MRARRRNVIHTILTFDLLWGCIMPKARAYPNASSSTRDRSQGDSRRCESDLETRWGQNHEAAFHTDLIVDDLALSAFPDCSAAIRHRP